MSQHKLQAARADEKGKGKARTEPAAGLDPQSLLGVRTQGPSDRELKDIELAIKLSLEDGNAADAKKTSPGKTVRLSPGVCSCEVS